MVFLETWGNAPGLIDHNAFNCPGNCEMIHNGGMGPQDDSGWAVDVVPGSASAVYIEDNTFTNNDPELYTTNPASFWGSSAVQSYYGARTVFRHNYLFMSHVDQHGTPGMIGARWWEIYENTFDIVLNGNVDKLFGIRAGSGVIFNNHVTGAKNGGWGGISLYEEDTGTYPLLYQVGRGKNQSADPAYVWGNDPGIPVGSGNSVALNRDYYLAVKPGYTPYQYPHPLQGTSGTGGTATADDVPPVPGNAGLISSEVSSTSAALSWAKASDNASSPSSLQYEIRLSTSSDIGTVANAEAYGAVVKPYTADINSVTVPGWSAGVTYYFNTIVRDGAGNKSAYQMTSVTIPSAPATTSTSTEIIAANRRINWSAGVQGGIPERTTVCATVNADKTGSTDATAAIQSAINNCPPGQVVSIPAGAYRLNSQISIAKGITVRCAAPLTTFLRSYANWHAVQFGNFPSAPVSTNVSGSPAVGSTTITVASITSPSLSVGDYIVIDQLNDGVEIINTDDESRNGGTRSLREIKKITAVNSLTITFDPPLYHSYSAGLDPEVWELNQSNPMTVRAGLEDCTVERVSPTGFEGVSNLKIVNCVECWVKNVTSKGAQFRHVDLDRSYRNEIRDSYFDDGQHHGTGGFAYGVVAAGGSADNLIENNIFRHLRHAMVVKEGASGNVYAYNYSLESYQGENWLAADLNAHGAHTQFNLFEGNIAAKVYGDFTHGSSSYNTVFRNHVTRASTPPEQTITSALRAVDIERTNWFWNIVGNVLGQPSQSWDAYDPGASRSASSGRYVYTFGFGSDGDGSRDDSSVSTNIYVHGNWDEQTDSVIWNSGNSNHTLPASLYLSSKPAFFGSCAWPVIGPDLSPRVGTLPARARYEGSSACVDTASDNTPPAITMSVPASGAIVSGASVAVSASASDNVGVVGVQFKLDGVSLGVEDTTSPYSISWNSTTASYGSHALTAVARDAAGNIATSAGVTVTVDNSISVDSSVPTVSLNSPADGAILSGASVTLSATASDNVGVVGVQFKLDGVNVGGEDTTSPYSITWNSATATNGSHTLTALARDASGNTATSAGRTVTVDNLAPAPGSGGQIATNVSSSSVTLNWTLATDSVWSQSALQYEVRRSSSSNIDTVANAEANGVVIKTYTSNINGFVVTGLSPSTTYFFNVIVRDGAGNKAAYVVRSATTVAAPDATAPIPGSGGQITSSNITSTSVTLGWTLATDNVSSQSSLQYEVRRSSSGNIDTLINAESNGAIVRPYGANISSFVMTGLSPSTTYFFNVIVKDEAGNKAVYAMKGATTAAVLDTSAPVPGNSGLMTSVVTSNSATLSWTKANDAKSAQSTLQYEVRRSSSANLDSVFNAESNGAIVKPYTVDINSFVVSGLTPGTTYFFNVIVKDEAGNKAAYAMKGVTTATSLDTSPPVPGNSGQITTNATSNSMTLTWAKANDNASPQPALRYEVRLSGSDNISNVADAVANGTIVKPFTADLTTFTVSGLNAGTYYYVTTIVMDEAMNKSAYVMKGTTTIGRKTNYDTPNGNNGKRPNSYTTSTALPPEPDAIAPVPGAAGLITVSGVSQTGLTLVWTMATDNNTPQAGLQYEVRQSVSGNMNTVVEAEANGTVVLPYTPYINSYVVKDVSNPSQYYFTVIVRDEAGNRAAYATTGNVAVRYSFLSNGGDSFNTTSLSTSSLSLNQVRITPAQGTAMPSGVAIVRFAPNGKLVSEGGFSVTAAARSGSVYVDITGATDAVDGTSTGIALSNPSSQDAEISYSFVDAMGAEVQSGLYVLPANQQLSAFLNQSPFNAPGAFRGTFTFSSSVPVNVAGMRGATNTSGISLFSSLPVVSGGLSENPLLPIFVDGGGWSTQVVLMNRSASPQQGTVQFFGPGSTETAPLLEMNVNGITDTTFSYALPPYSVTRLVTAGVNPLIAGGSVRVTPAGSDTLSSAAAPEVLGILSLKRDGRTLTESSIQAVSTSTAFRGYVESISSPQSVNSILAIVNAASVPNVVSYQFMTADGTPMGSVSSITLPAGGQISKFVRDLASGLPDNFQGLIRLTSTGPIGVAIFRSTYNSLGNLLYTSTPAVNEASAPQSTGLAFPMVATGGGYDTQLVMFGPSGQAGSGDMLFVSKDGVPRTGSSLGIAQ